MLLFLIISLTMSFQLFQNFQKSFYQDICKDWHHSLFSLAVLIYSFSLFVFCCMWNLDSIEQNYLYYYESYFLLNLLFCCENSFLFVDTIILGFSKYKHKINSPSSFLRKNIQIQNSCHFHSGLKNLTPSETSSPIVLQHLISTKHSQPMNLFSLLYIWDLLFDFPCFWKFGFPMVDLPVNYQINQATTNTIPKPTLLKRFTNREKRDVIKVPVKVLLTFEVAV